MWVCTEKEERESAGGSVRWGKEPQAAWGWGRGLIQPQLLG